MITEDQLRRIMPGANAARVTQYFPHLQAAMDEFEINTPARVAAFLAQLAHESGQLRFMEEIWGPTSAQRRYEPVTTLSRNLGNTVAGDGFRFKGRGPIQLTGRANYKRFGDLLGVDLVGNPAQAATPEIAFRIAALFWKNRGLNPLADAQNFREITRRINGGFNGLADRVNFYNRAKAVLGVGSAAAPSGATRAGASMPGRAGAAPPLRAGAGRAGAGPMGSAGGGGAEDGGLSRGIMPGDPQFARLLSEGGTSKSGASAKKAGAKGGAKKAGAKKSGAKKAAGKKSGAAKKAAAKKGGAKKVGAKKGAVGKGGASAKKSGAKKRR